MSNQSVDYSIITMMLSVFSLGLSIITVVILVIITNKMQYKEFTKAYRRRDPMLDRYIPPMNANIIDRETYVKSANKVE